MTWQRKHMVESMQHGIERVCAIACVRDIDHVNDAAEKQYTFNYLLDDIHDRTTTT